MTKARDIADFKFENIVDTGTEGTRVATGTSAQRGSTQGQIRFNSTTGLAEYFDGSQFKSIDAPPTISSILPTTATTANENITITGSNFSTGATVKFVGNDGTEYASPSVTRNSNTEIVAQTPTSVLTVANEPYDVIVTNQSGLSGTLADALDAGSSPAFTVASGTLGNLNDFDRAGSNLTTIGATDADGQSVTISLKSGSSLPTGLTLNSNGTFSGTASAVVSDTTTTFTVEASDGVNINERQYSITVKAPVATGGSIQTYDIGGTTYVSHTFLSSGTFILNSNKTVDVLLVGGGGAGGSHITTSSTGGGGGGAGGFREIQMSLAAGSFTATVGQGGSHGTFTVSLSNNGSDSSFNGYSATGGGRGDARTTAGSSTVGNGGSGGGAGYDYPDIVGLGNTPSTSPSQGNNGGQGFGVSPISPTEYPSYADFAGGGGGGAGSVGGNWYVTGNNVNGGHGGDGKENNYRTGTNQYYAAGGGGGSGSVGTRGNGGSSIGGSGGDDNLASTNPTANTGSGGGGAGGNSGLYESTSGADGIIVIRYAA